MLYHAMHHPATKEEDYPLLNLKKSVHNQRGAIRIHKRELQEKFWSKRFYRFSNIMIDSPSKLNKTQLSELGFI